MRNLQIQLALIRNGYIYDGEMLQLEADTVDVQNALIESISTFDNINIESLLEADNNSFIETVKNRIKMICEAIFKMIIDFVQKLKMAYSKLRNKLIKRKQPYSEKTIQGSDNVSNPQSQPQSQTYFEKTVVIPGNVLNPRNGFDIEMLKINIEAITTVKDDPKTIPIGESSRDVFYNLIEKLFGTKTNELFGDNNDYMRFIYGEKREVNISSLDANKILNQINSFDTDLQILQNCAHIVKDSARRTESLYVAASSNEETMDKVIKHQYYIYWALNKIVGSVLSVYSERNMILIKIYNLI